MLTAIALGGVFVGITGTQLWERGTGEGGPAGAPLPATSLAIPRETGPPPLLPTAGYVVSPAGGFMTDASGRTIMSFTLPLRCGSDQLVIRDVPVSGRSLRFAGKALGRPVTVRVTARVLDRQHVRGSVTAEGRSCRSNVVRFSARVS